MSYVELKDIRVSYDGRTNTLENLDISMEKGELVSLLGPSGCGKTTTLRVIAGLIEPNGGDFIVGDNNLTKVPVHKRNFGMVFQSYALFPHLTVQENVAFGLKLRKESKEIINEKVKNILEVCGLSEFATRYPKQMSGGQRQRVALARALVIEPELLLLDEPLSNLDAKLRVSMRSEIKRIQQTLGITTVFVTHDQEECFSISDRVAVMNNGVIEQYDTPEMIYKYPKTEFVARFIGFHNFFTLSKQGEYLYLSKEGMVFETTMSNEEEQVTATIRPEDVCIVKSGEKQKNVITGTVEVRTFLGKAYQYDMKTNIGDITVHGDDARIYEVGDTLTLYLPAEKLILVK